MTSSHKRVNPPSTVNEPGGLLVPPAHPTTNRTLTVVHRCVKLQRVMIPKAPSKIPQGGTEHRVATPEMPVTGWLGDRHPVLPDAGPQHHGWWHAPNPTLEQDKAMFKMEMGKKKKSTFILQLKH